MNVTRNSILRHATERGTAYSPIIVKRSDSSGRQRAAVTPLPTTSRIDLKVMHYLASIMHSGAIHAPIQAAGGLAGNLYLDIPGVIVRATACAAPLFLREMEVEARETHLPALVLRHSSGLMASPLKADVVLPGVSGLSWFRDYQLFQGLAGDNWLVPSDYGPSIHLMRHGLFFSEHSPYSDEWDKYAGQDRAHAHLKSHLLGGISWL